jgi:hypothetical protein
VAECVNAPLSMAYSSKAMAIAIVNVMSFVLFSHILKWLTLVSAILTSYILEGAF